MAKKASFVSLLVILILLSLVGSVAAISISPGKIVIAYQPNSQQTFSFDIGRADIIETYLTGELANYTVLNDPAPRGGARTITAVLTQPAGLSPGRHSVLVGAIESAPEGVMVGGRAAVQAPIYVDVPYPGVYLEASLAAYDINVGEKEKFSVAVSNKGKEAVSQMFVKIEVFDFANNKVAELASAEKSLAGLGSASFELEWDSSGATAGNYRAVAAITYDGNELAREAKFKIGSLNVEIVSYSTEFEAGAISPFFIEITGGWNDLIPGIYAELKISDKVFKTPTFDLPPWKTINLTGYVDASNIPEGGYSAQFIVYYSDKTAEKTAKVIIAKGVGNKPITEKPGFIEGAELTTMLIIALIAVFAAALVALVYIAKQRNKR